MGEAPLPRRHDLIILLGLSRFEYDPRSTLEQHISNNPPFHFFRRRDEERLFLSRTMNHHLIIEGGHSFCPAAAAAAGCPWTCFNVSCYFELLILSYPCTLYGWTRCAERHRSSHRVLHSVPSNVACTKIILLCRIIICMHSRSALDTIHRWRGRNTSRT